MQGNWNSIEITKSWKAKQKQKKQQTKKMNSSTTKLKQKCRRIEEEEINLDN